jgi:PRTRC genetic system ThiF family protein
MIYDHLTHPELLAERVHVALAGAGGSGSLMLSGLARLDAAIRALGHPGLDVTVYDPDDVSEANLGRQLFAPADVGHNKATVLVTRTNAWYGTRWNAQPYAFDPETRRPGANAIGIVVSCVDSARARIRIGQLIGRLGMTPYYWLDLGNRAADGQVVLGIPPQDDEHRRYVYRLPTVLEIYPELATAEEKDQGPSCSLAQALERQELFVNQAVVTPALQLLWLVFRYGRTNWCGAFVNLKTGRMAPLPVDPEAWARFGHHADQHVGLKHLSNGAVIRLEQSEEAKAEVAAMLEEEATA